MSALVVTNLSSRTFPELSVPVGSRVGEAPPGSRVDGAPDVDGTSPYDEVDKPSCLEKLSLPRSGSDNFDQRRKDTLSEQRQVTITSDAVCGHRGLKHGGFRCRDGRYP